MQEHNFELGPLAVAANKIQLLLELGVPRVYLVWECPTCHVTAECRVVVNNIPGQEAIGLYKTYRHDACGTVIDTLDPNVRFDARGFARPGGLYDPNEDGPVQ